MEPPERSPDRDDFGIQLKWPAAAGDEASDTTGEGGEPHRLAPAPGEPRPRPTATGGRVARRAPNVVKASGPRGSDKPDAPPRRPPPTSGPAGPDPPRAAPPSDRPSRSPQAAEPPPSPSDAPPSSAGSATRGAWSGRSSTTLGSLSERVERIGGALANLSRQVDEHAAAMAELAREQALTLEKHRRGNDRALADLGRALEGTSQAVKQVSARVDGYLRSQQPAAGREVLDAVLALHDDAYNELTSLRESVRSLGSSVEQLAAEQDASVRGDAAAGDALARPLAEIRSHLAKLDEVPSQLAALERLAAAVANVGDLSELQATLGSVHEELVGLRRSLAMLSRNGLALGDDQVEALADAVAARLAERPALLRSEQLSILAEAVVDRLEQTFEVVDDEGSHAT